MIELKTKRLLVVVLLLILMSPLLATSKSGNIITAEDVSSSDENAERGVDVGNLQVVEPERYAPDQKTPLVVSLDGKSIDTIPDFVYRNNDESPSQSLSSGFSLASYSDPNITEIYWQNMTEGSDEEWVTWMQPGGDVRIWLKVKGPLESAGPIVTVSFEKVMDASSTYGFPPLDAADLNGVVELGENDTAWLIWDQTLPENELGIYYGLGPLSVNAFALRLYHPTIVPLVYDIYYEGLNHPHSFLNMYGEFDVKEVKWYNSTGLSQIAVALKGWSVSPRYTISVRNAPVWNIKLKTGWYADVVWGLDVLVKEGAVQEFTIDDMLYPGNNEVYPRISEGSDEWDFAEIDPTKDYGTGLGNRRGIYCKLFVYELLIWTELCSSNNEDALLYVLESRYEQAPQIQVVAPLNGEVFTGSTLNIDAFISDGNSNYDIDTLLLYLDGTETDVLSDYHEIEGRLITSVDLPQENSIVNITIYAEDRTGLSDSATLLIRSDDPNAYFPSGYTPGHEHYIQPVLEKEFVWEQRLTYEPSGIVNITFTPRLTITVTPAIEFDLYYARPSSISAGDDFATYVMIVDPRISLTIDILLESDCELRFETWTSSSQDVEIFRESWYASRSIGLGVEVLDLRYDLPNVSRYIRPFTHFEVDLLDIIPVITAFADLNLIVDIVPILKISNVLDAIVSGIDCTPQLTEISFVSERMFVIESSVADTLSGTSCELQLSDLEMSSAAGFDLSVALKLAGAVGGMTIGEVDLNE